jgi:hypothetical protein
MLLLLTNSVESLLSFCIAMQLKLLSKVDKQPVRHAQLVE